MAFLAAKRKLCFLVICISYSQKNLHVKLCAFWQSLAISLEQKSAKSLLLIRRGGGGGSVSKEIYGTVRLPV